MMSSLIFVEILREFNTPSTWIDVRNIIATDSHFGKAAPNDHKTQENSTHILKPLIDRGELIITQGFIGRDEQGKTTTLGRGGSDYSAALLAEVLNAKDVLIWTDVAGIYTTDPRIVPNAKRIDTMSFSEVLKWQPLVPKSYIPPHYCLQFAVIFLFMLAPVKRLKQGHLGNTRSSTPTDIPSHCSPSGSNSTHPL